MMGDMSNSTRSPFTSSQWQELEHQALVFNYMVSGTPVPHDLILPIRTLYPEPDYLSDPHYSRIVGGPMDFGRNKGGEDPEPGRCRRTDGKKWRCSREAYPDSKYCERHMHRGKNRSRKHVEAAPINGGITSNSTSSRSGTTITTTTTTTTISLAMAAASEARHHSAVHPYSSVSPGDSTATGVPPRSSSSLRFNHGSSTAASSSGDKDHRTSNAPPNISVWDFFRHGPCSSSEEGHCSRGLKEVADSYSSSTEVIPTASRNWRPGRISPLRVGTLGERAGRRSRSPASGPQLQRKSRCFTSVEITTEEEESRKRQQYCFVLGADLMSVEKKPAATAAAEEDDQEEPRQPLRHFFDDGPSNSKHPWMPFTTL